MIDKIQLIKEPTIVQRLKYSVEGCTIYMKRDDLINFGGGGNKVRLFEYIGAEIIRKKAEKIVTFGSEHSNHIRVAATVAAHLGLSCDLIILSDGEEIKNSPNTKLINYLNSEVNIVYCNTSNAHDFIDEYLLSLDVTGVKYFWIPGGGHMPIAINGYVDASNELKHQLNDNSVNVLFLPCGTGTTQAGLIAGLKNEMIVYGITVARSVDRCEEEIRMLLDEAGVSFNSNDVRVLNSNIPYGSITSEIRQIISDVAKSDGIFLDPVYNAKAFYSMSQFLKANRCIKNAVYLNTGGFPNMFVDI